MFRTSAFLAVILNLLVSAGAQTTTPTSTTMAVTALTLPIASTDTSAMVGGMATFNPGLPDNNGAFSGTVSLTNTPAATDTVLFTIVFQSSASTLTGSFTVPAGLLSGTTTSGTGSGTITGGTGPYSGLTGLLTSLSATASGSMTNGFTLSFSGTVSLTTGLGGSTTPAPTVTAVVDAGGYTPSIAEGGVFVVKGTNLSPAGFNTSAFPLLTAYNSVSITFTPASGGTGTNAYLLNTYNQSGVNQLAAVLPSILPAGSYNVTVTNNGSTSAPFLAQVVKSKPGLFSQDGSGTGLAVVQNYISQTELDVDRFTTGSVSGMTYSPAQPGQPLIAWGTGFGPVTGGDNVASAGYDFTANGVTVQVIVGGMPITPSFAGRAPGLAGTDQIVFTLPSNVPTGCTVPFQVSVNGLLSNPTFISIAPGASSTACVLAGFTTAQLQNLDQGVTIRSGGFSLLDYSAAAPTGSVTYNSVSGGFTQRTGFQLAAAAASLPPGAPSGACTVSQSPGNAAAVTTSSAATSLDAGTITLTGPAGSSLSSTPVPETSNSYLLPIGTNSNIPGAVNGSIVAGTYTLSGAGGTDVGPFTASVTLGPPLVVTGDLSTTVVRSQGLTLNWTGGNPTDFLKIVGYSSSTTSGVTTTVTFTCTTTAGQHTFTVPSSILQQLPAAASSGTSLAIESGPNGSFPAPLVAGGLIDFGVFSGFTAVVGMPSYQ